LIAVDKSTEKSMSIVRLFNTAKMSNNYGFKAKRSEKITRIASSIYFEKPSVYSMLLQR
jgi:hypothetical protein